MFLGNLGLGGSRDLSRPLSEGPWPTLASVCPLEPSGSHGSPRGRTRKGPGGDEQRLTRWGESTWSEEPGGLALSTSVMLECEP